MIANAGKNGSRQPSKSGGQNKRDSDDDYFGISTTDIDDKRYNRDDKPRVTGDCTGKRCKNKSSYTTTDEDSSTADQMRMRMRAEDQADDLDQHSSDDNKVG